MATIIGFDEDILKKQNIHYKLTCPKCAAISIFEKKEIKHCYDQRDQESWNECVCPNCKNVLLLPGNLKQYEYDEEPQHNLYIENYEKNNCTRCKFYDGYDICLANGNFGTVTNKQIKNCINNKLFSDT